MRVSASLRGLMMLLLPGAVLALAGTSLPGEDITCLDGQVIKDVLSVSTKPDGIAITTADGIFGVRFTNLSPALCAKYGYEPFAAGLYHASHPHRTINHLTDAYSLDQLDLARSKALSTGKCLGFIVVCGTFFEVEADPTSEGSSNALAQFHQCFQDSLVLVYVRHETELGSVPEAARKGLLGPDAGGGAPSMAVTDPTLTDFICEIPPGGPHANGADRLQVFRTGIERIKAYLAAHGATSMPAAGIPAAAPAAPASPPPVRVAANEPPIAPTPAAPTPGSPAAGPAPATTPGTSDQPAAGTTDAASAAGSNAGATEPDAVEPISYQEVTLHDGRVLSGHLTADQSKLVVINLKTGKDEGSLDIGPDDIQTIVRKHFVPMANQGTAVSPHDRQVRLFERAVVMSVLALNQARSLSAVTAQEQLDWNRATHKPSQDVEVQAEFKAHVDNLHARLERAKAAVPVAKTAYDQALAAYRALGGTRVFTGLLIEPKPPK